VAICSTDAPVDLFTFLGPNAQTGGTWSLNDLPFSGIYNPAVDAPGQYRYRVNGQAPCSADFAFITVTEPLAAEAGTSASVDICSDATPFNMRDLLGGLPQQGGAWSAPGGAAHTQTFDPAVDVEGDYRYLITGATPCANDTAYLTVNLFAAPNAEPSTADQESPSAECHTSAPSCPATRKPWSPPTNCDVCSMPAVALGGDAVHENGVRSRSVMGPLVGGTAVSGTTVRSVDRAVDAVDEDVLVIAPTLAGALGAGDALSCVVLVHAATNGTRTNARAQRRPVMGTHRS
jgi:hypothetical protein